MKTTTKKKINKITMLEYLKSLAKVNSGNSSKSFSVIVSAIIGALMGLCVCFAIIYDVITNGMIKTDLTDMGIFILCIGGYSAGSSVAKVFGDRYGEKEERDDLGSPKETEE